MSTSFITGDHNHRDEDATGSALPRTNLFLENHDSKMEVDDSGVVLSAKEKRFERKRQRQVSVSKLYHLCITKVLILSIENRTSLASSC
jgi:hypothetical protein